MSVELIVYLERSAMPTPDRWRQAISDAGFPLELDADFDVDTQQGFLPCQFRGADAGFEYFSHQVDEQERRDDGVPQDADFAVTLVTHSDLRELASSIVAAGVLCHESGGLLVDPQSEESCSSERAMAWIKEQMTDLDPHID